MFKWTSKTEVASNGERKELTQLNRDYTDCLVKEFVPAFLEGKDVQVDNFCVAIREKMLSLDKKVYQNDHF